MKPPIIKKHGSIFVVRDDLIDGGTKVRILPLVMTKGTEFVYATSAYGYAQVALAYAARLLGKRATVFVAHRSAMHPHTLEAMKVGAKIVQVPHGYLSNVQSKATAYCERTGATLLPFGLDDPVFVEALASIAKHLPIEPKEVWCVAGSGMLSRSLQRAWPKAECNTVQIGRDPDVGNAEWSFKAPEKFEALAKVRPPFPSCANYDAKAWQFIQEHASDGALFWNVAR